MSKASFDTVLRELRDTAPRAPERLRDLVSSTACCSAAAIDSSATRPFGRDRARDRGRRRSRRHRRPQRLVTASKRCGFSRATGATCLGGRMPTRRGRSSSERAHPGSGVAAPALQVSMQLRVQDLSAATQRAVRTTRRLGGYVATADYATATSVGESRLGLRVPIQNVQRAIAQFTDLGTLLSQHISVKDLQAASTARASPRPSAPRGATSRHAEQARGEAAMRSSAKPDMQRSF